MMRKGSLLLIGCLAIGLVACNGGDDNAVCGDGVAQGREQCDLTDLRNFTCADVVSGSSGTLSCTVGCTYDTTGCALCGDGIKNFGEGCDCGTDPNNLPATCMDVNGGANANCTTECVKIATCGDGFVDDGEGCDCGTTTPLPTGCTDVNGGANANCDADCVSLDSCNPATGLWLTCDALAINECCPDDWDVDLECTSLSSGAVCLRPCTAHSDCYWSNFCNSQVGMCWPEVVGPNWPNTAVNNFCAVTGAGQGWAWPLFGREDPTDAMYGICIEAGDIAHGQPCEDYSIDGIDRSEGVCNMGVCLSETGVTTGDCAGFCDWEAAYAVAIYDADPSTEILPCPAGSNCASESYLRVEDDPLLTNDVGVRSGDLSYCRPTEATNPTHPFAATTCSLLTQQLMSDPTQTCADVLTEGVCVMMQFSGGEITNGTLVGVCYAGTAPTVTNVWDTCVAGTDTCPRGTVCVEEDIFATTPSGQTRCVPYCDTEYHTGVNDCLEAYGGDHMAVIPASATWSATPICRSQSLLHPPGGPLDIYKTRLGLCAMD